MIFAHSNQAILLAALFVFSGFLSFVGSAAAQSNVVVDRVVAVIEDEVILKSDVDAFLFNFLQQQRERVQYSEELWHEAYNELINQKVMVVHAKRDTLITVSEDQVEQALDERIQMLTRQLGGEQAVEEAYGRSIVQMRSDFRNEIRSQLLAQQLQQRQLHRIRITPSEVREWFSQFPLDSLPMVPETVRLAHIVRYPEILPAAREEARHMISAVRDSILAGVPIEDLARRFSDDPGSAQRGGHYENINLGELVPEFGAVAATLEPGQVSQVFETTFGYHVMRLNNRLGDIIDFNHVLIRIDDSRTDPTRAVEMLSTIRDSIVTYNRPFELMAKRHSEESFTANRGGFVINPRTGERDLPLNELPPTWRRNISALSVDQISEPAEVELFDGRRARHILLLQRRVPAHRMNLEMDYSQIEQIALQEKRARELGKWLERLRDDVYINMLVQAQDVPTARAN